MHDGPVRLLLVVTVLALAACGSREAGIAPATSMAPAAHASGPVLPPPPSPLPDLSTDAALAPTSMVASTASGLTLASRDGQSPMTPATTQRVTLEVHVTRGATELPHVQLDLEASSSDLFAESLELHCSGEARRDGARLVVDSPACTRWASSPGQCPHDASAITLDVAPDGSVALLPFDAALFGGTCEGYSTVALRIGAAHLGAVR